MPCSGSIRCSTRWCLIGERSSSGIRNLRERPPAPNMLIEVGLWAPGREDAPEAYFEDVVRFPEADRHREIWRSLIVLDPKEDGRSIAWCGAHVEPSALCHSFASKPVTTLALPCPHLPRPRRMPLPPAHEHGLRSARSWRPRSPWRRLSAPHPLH